MTSARSVFLYLCVGLAAIAALALSAAAATPGGFPYCAENCSAPNPEFLSGHSLNFASQPVANAESDVSMDAHAGRLVRVASGASAANANYEFQNTQKNTGSTTRRVGSSARNEKRGTGSL
jgi:hypothetical protein